MSKLWPLLLALCPLVASAQEWEDPFTIYANAQQSLAQGDAETAKTALQSLASRGVTLRGFWFLYGVALLGVNDRSTAKDAFQRAIQEEPSHGQAHFYLALLALAEEDPKTATEHLQQADKFLPPDDPLAESTKKLLASLKEKPKRFDLSLKVGTQGDSNPLLSPEASPGARFVLDTSGSLQQKLSKNFSLQASIGAAGALPFANTEALAPLDAFGFNAALSTEAKFGDLSFGASGFGKLLRRDFLQEALLQETGALALLQRRPARLAYRITRSDFELVEAEGTAFDQDNLTQEVSLTLSKFGVSLGALASQSEADGNSLDRQGGSLQLGYVHHIKKTTMSAFVDAGVMSFPNAGVARDDQRLLASASLAQKIKTTVFSLSYVGVVNQSTDALSSYTRHLLTLEAQWQP